MPTDNSVPLSNRSEPSIDPMQPPPAQSTVTNQSGGVDLDATEVTVGADVVGRDKIVQNIYNYYNAESAAGPASSPTARSAQVFISYKRDVEPDEPLALQLYHALEERNHKPFIDQAMRIGVDWAKEIQRQVESADFFIVLLSPPSAHSEMVAAEIKYAYDHFSVHGRPRILPVRLAFAERLPYQLSNYLDRIQYARWREEADTEIVINALLGAIEGEAALPTSATGPLGALTPGEVNVGDDGRALAGGQISLAPLPHFDPRLLLEVPSGAVKLKSQFYVERDSDSLLRRQVMADGTTTTIRAPRQMGKTSLLVRGVKDARQMGQQVIYLDLQRVNESYLSSLDGLLRYIADEIAQRMNLDAALVDRAWASSRGAQDKLSNFLERQVLPAAETPILLTMDEADRLLNVPYKTDFFGLLRAWDSNRAYDENWQRLNIVLIISTHPHLLITDVSQSPFNVGLRIQLNDFTNIQVSELNRRHGSPMSERDLDKLLELLGGHPYLTRQALYTLIDQQLSWTDFARQAALDDGPFGSHLRSYLWQLSERPELVKGMQEVLMRERCSDETVRYRLSAAGLVKEIDDRAVPRCGLYKQYFGAKLR